MKTQINTTIEKQEEKIRIEIVVIEGDKETDRLLIEHNKAGSFVVNGVNGTLNKLFNHNYYNP